MTMLPREPIEDISDEENFVFCLYADDATKDLSEKASEAFDWIMDNTTPSRRRITMEVRESFESQYTTRYGRYGSSIQDIHVRFLEKEDAAKFKLLFM